MNNSYNERSMKIIDLKKTILEDNDVDADRLREELKKKNVFYSLKVAQYKGLSASVFFQSGYH